MQRSIKEIQDYVLEADDGEIGRCKDFIFDDGSWTVRYMVADTGKWLPKKKVLISPISLGKADWESKTYRVELTKSQIEACPGLDENAPVSREYEKQLFDHFGWSPYWIGTRLWGMAAIPTRMAVPEPGKKSESQTATMEVESPFRNLRSAGEVMGYHIQATDGEIGHVEDFIMDDTNWTLRYVVVDTRNILPGKKVLLAPQWVNSIEWRGRKMNVDLSKDLIKNGPSFDYQAPINREYEIQLYDYYGRPKYWD